VAEKKFDPLWEIIDEKVALQNVEPDIDVPCPHCHVPLHLDSGVSAGTRLKCGLCGGSSVVVETAEGPSLKAD